MSHEYLPSVSLVVPTLREAENLPPLLEAVSVVREEHALDLEVWIMDDDSRDGTVAAVEAMGLSWVHLVVRTRAPGLCEAVLDGISRASGRVVVVMDADGSHSPAVIPSLVRAVAGGADFAIGSRYAPGGAVDPGWGILRMLNSRVATLLARPLTSARDPMSGFFAIARERVLDARERLSPVGYKIGLELIVRCGCEQIAEVPIAFARRERGRSKLTIREQLRYLEHLRRLYLSSRPGSASALLFGLVGASGAVVNLAVAALLALSGAGDRAAIGGGIMASVCSNFALNRRLTFPWARSGPVLKQFAGFAAASSAGLLVNYLVSVAMRVNAGVPLSLAVCSGIAAGMGLNYLASRFVVFRQTTSGGITPLPSAATMAAGRRSRQTSGGAHSPGRRLRPSARQTHTSRRESALR